VAESFPIPFGRYQLVERLAVGGMAELFLAAAPGEHGFAKKLVIKRLLPHLNADPTYNAMFVDEAKLTARLVHPKIAQTFELAREGDMLFIAMEYIEGIDVLALLRECAQRRRRIDAALAAWICHEVLDALDYAHHLLDDSGQSLGIVHRDISPSNILLSMRGDIKLVDFGIARAADPQRSHKTKSGTLKGKYGYMSPEQVVEQQLDQRSDLFSVGVVLAELLTGRRLFAAANELDVLLMVRDARLTRLDKYGSDIDPELSEIVRRALRKNPDERWPSAAVFRDAISEWLYQTRNRINAKTVAEFVADIRDSASVRKHEAAQAEVAQTAVLDDAQGAAMIIDRPPDRGERPVVQRAQSQADGIPISLDLGDSMPVVMVSYDEASRRHRAASESEGGGRAERVTDAPPTSRHRRPEIVVDLDEDTPVEVPKLPTAARPRQPAPMGDGAQAAHPAMANFSEALAPEVLPPETLAPPFIPPRTAVRNTRSLAPATGLSSAPGNRAPEAATAYPSIAAAMGAIVPMEPDPSSRDFDGKTVLPGRRSAEPPIPSADEVARKPTPPPPQLGDIQDHPDDSGDFSVISPLRVLFRLMLARSTGLLVVAIGGIKKEVYVRDGQPEYVSSNVASELFGSYLVSKGVLSDGELAMALAMMPHYGGRLGDTLVGLGLLKPLEVFRHLTRQVRTKLIDVCTWNKGTFAWYANRENAREAFPLDFNAFEILGAGAMALPDDLVDAWLARNSGTRLRAVKQRRLGPDRFEVKGLVEMFDFLDGRRTVGDLVELQPDRAERLRVGRMLCLLEACDMAKT
jgi:eukaryotic-like serine/threonine-protein kinase